LVDEDHLPLDVLLAAGECRSSGVRDGIASVLRGVDNPGAPAALEALKKVKPGLLVVILPKDCDVPAMVKQVAKELAFQNGPCQVRHGPVQMTRGVAEAILAQIDMKEGTSYLSRHFEVGTGMALKTEFGYILCP
jgi:hypothetical protein